MPQNQKFLDILRNAHNEVRARGGYGCDLLVSFIRDYNNESAPTQQDADSLFRTLILDDYMSLQQATDVYRAASDLIGD